MVDYIQYCHYATMQGFCICCIPYQLFRRIPIDGSNRGHLYLIKTNYDPDCLPSEKNRSFRSWGHKFLTRFFHCTSHDHATNNSSYIRCHCNRCSNDTCGECYIRSFVEGQGVIVCPWCRSRTVQRFPPHMIMGMADTIRSNL